MLTRAGDAAAALDVFARLMPTIDVPLIYVPAFAEALLAAGRVDEAVAEAAR